ncbi:hypothetical protein [Yoonia sp. R2-816]|uniref:hypothetical protein n=1 Tax=Yoonia sp. R2-816 TaxID=3342638 RepID=UPI00372A4A92
MIIDADGEKRVFERDGNRRELVTGKERTFQSRTGLDFWFNYNTDCALTSDPEIFVYFYQNTLRGNVGTFPILHIQGRALCFTRRPWSRKESYDAVRPRYGKDGQSTWEIGEMGLSMHHKDPDQARVYYPLTNADKFRDEEQQELGIGLLQDVLSKTTGNWVAHAHGREKTSNVFLTPEFQKKLRSGALLEG